MPHADDEALTERQRKWFASIREGIRRDTGRSLEEWAELARDCPVTPHRARLAWMKEKFGLGQNRASIILDAAFPAAAGPANSAAIWSDPKAASIRDAVVKAALDLGELIVTERKAFTAFSRAVQFAAMRPGKDGNVRLGLAVLPEIDPDLVAARRESWSERLKSVLILADAGAVDGRVRALLRRAWEGAS